MKIRSDLVGLSLKQHIEEVTWRKTTNYAAAISDINPFYFEDYREEGIIAPPMFAVVISWSAIRQIMEDSELGFNEDIFSSMVHYSEHIEFNRLVNPGEKLTVEGGVAAVLPQKGGTHLILKLDVKDNKSLPVHTEYFGVMLRGVSCEDEGRGQDSLLALPQAQPQVQTSWETGIYVAHEAPYIYDGCTDIVFAIHTSPKYARQVGLPDIILQGTATLAYAVRELVNREVDGDPRNIKTLSCRFKGMVVPGTHIKIVLLQRKSDGKNLELFFHVENSEGAVVISEGYTCFQI